MSLALAAGTDQYGNPYPQGLMATEATISGGTIIGPDYIINSQGIFSYAGTPAEGNLIGWWTSAPGTDQFGNAYGASVAVGPAAGPQVLLIPLGSAGAAIGLPTNAADEIIATALYAQVDNAGLANQYLLFGITGPANVNDAIAGGFEVQMTSASDDETVPPSFALFDNASNYYLVAQYEALPGPQMGLGASFSGADPVMGSNPVQVTLNGGVLMYSAGGLQTAIYTSSGTFPKPAGVSTARVRAWAAGSGGRFNSGPGGGSGEYAEEPALGLTGALTITIGAEGKGGTSSVTAGTAGGNTTVTGGSVPVTAHGAPAAGLYSSAGGTGSTNTIHENGSGSVPSGTGGNYGGAGGAGAPGAGPVAGGAGNPNSGRSPGAGGLGAGGGGTGGGGGWGSTSGSSGATAGAPGAAPGAGGGAAGYSAGSGPDGGNGGKGMVIISWTAPGATSVLASVASVAGTDPMGNAIPAGFQGQMVAVQPGSSPSVAEVPHSLSAYLTNSWSVRTGSYLAQFYLLPTGRVQVDFELSHASTSGTSVLTTALPAAYWPAHAQDIPCGWSSTGSPTSSPTVQLSTAGVLTAYGLPTGTTLVQFSGSFPLD